MNLASLIDHTYLKSVAPGGTIRSLCREAVECGFASVCVNPCEVVAASRLLKGSKVKVCTVIDFPLGQSTPRARAFEAMDAIQCGADELDLVVNQTLLKTSPAKCEAELLQWVRTCRTFRSDVVLKLILECCNLSKAEIKRGCQIAERVGFDFVKTSTGFGQGGAVVEDVRLMRKSVSPRIGVKAAGGIRTRPDALKMVQAGAARIGTSAGKGLLV